MLRGPANRAKMISVSLGVGERRCLGEARIMKPADIALGFANTVDYEEVWNPAHLEELILETGLQNSEVSPRRKINSLKDLLSSIVCHFREGTGCGMLVSDPHIVEEYLKGARCMVRLGGTNVRAALAIASQGYPSLVHLVSVNPDTTANLPPLVQWICSDPRPRCFPHIVVQFPAGAELCANDIRCRAPRANRVIYSGDTACSALVIAAEFLARAEQSRIWVLSSFDLVYDQDVLRARLDQVEASLARVDPSRTLVYYEDACFADQRLAAQVRRRLRGKVAIYSMNEDEFQAIVQRPVRLLDAADVLDALDAAAGAMPGSTLLVHTRHWALLYGADCARYRDALQGGMTMATARYTHGDGVTPELYARTERLPRQPQADAFAKRLAAICPRVFCLPAFSVTSQEVTTIGLGDSFVGGFALAYRGSLED